MTHAARGEEAGIEFLFVIGVVSQVYSAFKEFLRVKSQKIQYICTVSLKKNIITSYSWIGTAVRLKRESLCKEPRAYYDCSTLIWSRSGNTAVPPLESDVTGTSRQPNLERKGWCITRWLFEHNTLPPHVNSNQLSGAMNFTLSQRQRKLVLIVNFSNFLTQK